MQTRVTRNPGTRVTRFFVKPETRVWENPALLKPGFTGNETRVFKNIFNNNFRCKSHKTNYI